MVDANTDDGYVYVAKLMIPDHPVYKIGHCSLSMNRLVEYTKLPYDVIYIGIWKTEKRKDLEYELHQKFSKKRLNGEWFNLDSDDVKSIYSFFRDKKILPISEKEQPIIAIKSWRENKEPDGFDCLYVIKQKNGVFQEQDCGKVPYIYKNILHSKNNAVMKFYPTLGLDENNIKKQLRLSQNYDNNMDMKFWGSNRDDCFQKLIKCCENRITSDEEIERIIKEIKNKNEKIKNYIKYLETIKQY